MYIYIYVLVNIVSVYVIYNDVIALCLNLWHLHIHGHAAIEQWPQYILNYTQYVYIYIHIYREKEYADMHILPRNLGDCLTFYT